MIKRKTKITARGAIKKTTYTLILVCAVLIIIGSGAEGSPKTKLTAAEIERLSNSIVRLDCSEHNLGIHQIPFPNAVQTQGSGFLYSWEDTGDGKLYESIFTNWHVIEPIKLPADKFWNGSSSGCFAVSGSNLYPLYKDKSGAGGAYFSIRNSERTTLFNREADFVMITTKSPPFYEGINREYPLEEMLPLKRKGSYRNGHPAFLTPPSTKDTGYPTTPIYRCYEDMPLGSVVYAMGYPSYAHGKFIVAEGTIIGKTKPRNLPHNNYFTSAKIDSGMSGGAAFSITEYGETCLLGMNTWVAAGNHENAGVIQNWSNLVYIP